MARSRAHIRRSRLLPAASLESRSIVTRREARKRAGRAILMDSRDSSSSRSPNDSARPRVLITAGPTHEPIDRVRYIGNRSSGRMGIALAEACSARGWPATLLLGPVAIPPPQHSHLSVLRFQTAADLQRLLWEHWPRHDLLMMAAAVADYTVAGVRGTESRATPEKLKRVNDRVTLELVPTPDLLASLSPITRANQTVIGFALEPAADLMRESQRKLQGKRLDAIVANPLETMDSSLVSATLVFADGRSIPAPSKISKAEFALWLLDHIAQIRRRDS